MNSPVTHIVHKVVLEVHTHSTANAYYLKDHLDLFLKEEVFPCLESYFNTLAQRFPSQSSIRVEKLNLELPFDNRLHLPDLKLKIKGAVEKDIEKKLAQNIALKHLDDKLVIPAGEKLKNSFLYFLETGTKPWWDQSVTFDFLEDDNAHLKTFIRQRSFVTALKNVLQKSLARTRLIKQLNDRQIITLIEKGLLAWPEVQPIQLPDLQDFQDKINSNAAKPGFPVLEFRRLAWDILITRILNFPDAPTRRKIVRFIRETIKIDTSSKHETIETVISATVRNIPLISVIMQFDNVIQKIEKDINFLQKTQKLPKADKNAKQPFIKNVTDDEKANMEPGKATKKDKIPDNADDTIVELQADHYVKNAGLILLHPFLKQLFINSDLLHPDHSIKNPETAAHLLHYIATKQVQQYEYAMVFEKFLCNIPIALPVDKDIHLSGEIKQHAENMLKAVLEHWPVMKNASNDLLRNEYLKRPGKIILTGDNPRIIMERKTQDILLDKMEWNISIVKLPWKNKIIFVEW